MNEPLPPELCELEKQLSSLVPRMLSEETADRLTESVECDLCLETQDAGLDELEKHLGQIAPTTMRTDVLSRMIKAMDSWHEHIPVEEKVVSFSNQEEEQKQPRKKSGEMLAAVATVALLGAATALVMPRFFPQQDNGAVTTKVNNFSHSSDIDLTTVRDPKEAWLVPDAMSHKVVNTSDSGVVMARDNTPHRCIRLDGVDTIKMEDEDGREITISRPSVQYVLIPVETN